MDVPALPIQILTTRWEFKITHISLSLKAILAFVVSREEYKW